MDNLVEELAVATQPQGVPQFPQDLEATTDVVDKTVAYLQEDLMSSTPSQLKTVRLFKKIHVLQIIFIIHLIYIYTII